MPEFREKYAAVESLVHLWEENVPFTIVPITDSPNSVGNKQFNVSAVKIYIESDIIILSWFYDYLQYTTRARSF